MHGLVALYRRLLGRYDRVELAVIGAAAATFAALLASYTAFRPVRDALVLDGDPDKIPWIFLGTFVAVIVVSPLWSALLARRSPRGTVPLAFHAFAACAVGFFLVVRAEIAPVTVGRVFYIWSAVFNFFVVSVFWSLLADLLGLRNARRLYGPIAAGGTIGSILGPALTRGLSGTIGVAGVLLMSAILLEIAVFGVGSLRRVAAALPTGDGAGAAADADAPPGGGAFTGIAHVAKSPYLSAIVGYVLCTSCAATFLYLAQADLAKHALADRLARTEYFASIDLWVNGVTLALQVLIASPAIQRFGPAVVLTVLPLAQLTGISVLSLAPSLTSLAIIQVISRSATHGLTRPARELLYTVVSRDDKYRAKHAIDTIGYRFGDLASSWLYKGLLALSTGSGVLIAATAALVAVWLGFAAILGAGFRRRVTKEQP